MATAAGGVYSSSRFHFDEHEAERVVFFIEEFCRHVKGPRSGQPFILEAWQRDLLRDLFGWRRPDGSRRYRYVWMESPRKSGKSTLAAALSLYMLMVDPEPAAEIVIAAANSEHACICFNIARDMMRRDPDLAEVCRSYQRSLLYKDARLRVVSSRHASILGQNISCLIFDDVYLQTGRDLHDALITSIGARAQPLTIYATGAGWERSSLAWELHDYAMKVHSGAIDDPDWLVTSHGASSSEDWTDPVVWRRAHPGIGVTIPEEFFAAECRRAQRTPGFINTFRRLYLNVWGDERSRWLDMDKWDACGETSVDGDALLGRECYAGLDLSTTTDLSALVLAFPDADGGYTLLPFAFCPSEAMHERQRRDRVDYLSWRDQGQLIATEGNSIDHAAIRTKVVELSCLYRIRELAYDRWNASMLITQLQHDGLNCVPVAQTTGGMSPPSRELERVLAEGKLRHGGHPVLRWCAGNAVAHTDANGEVRPSKSKSSERIDVLVAALMAISRHLVQTWSHGTFAANATY